jgi:hypothetical protein
LTKGRTILCKRKDLNEENRNRNVWFTIRGAAWMNTGAWLGEEVVSVVIIVAFEPVKGETIWKTKNIHFFISKPIG